MGAGSFSFCLVLDTSQFDSKMNPAQPRPAGQETFCTNNADLANVPLPPGTRTLCHRTAGRVDWWETAGRFDWWETASRLDWWKTALPMSIPGLFRYSSVRCVGGHGRPMLRR